ncbi:hypothetical protein EWM64_g1423 [Hericium alpestre]|uniref:Aminotransferase class I/classII large domain-containing protein n=1 Tax=Hericium alpestre TaxID=135208 RepID=A0A4Z0A8E3_9AGAM|nr:hypothetical protein EWM64_g1423 [Hericium alpestre]
MAPLAEIVALLEELFPRGNGYLVVDEAHATGIYGPQGRGVVAMMGLEDKVLARLHTFGKALAATGAVMLTNTLLRDYLINYARPLIYTTSLSHSNIIAAGCSFDMLEDGTAGKLATQLLDLTSHFLNALRLELATIPSTIVSLPPHLRTLSDLPPTPIIPLLTPEPRPLSAFLLERGMNARPITWPTVPKGLDRVRVCLHAGLTKEDVNRFIAAVGEWAREAVEEAEREERRRKRRLMGRAVDGLLESKL